MRQHLSTLDPADRSPSRFHQQDLHPLPLQQNCFLSSSFVRSVSNSTGDPWHRVALPTARPLPAGGWVPAFAGLARRSCLRLPGVIIEGRICKSGNLAVRVPELGFVTSLKTGRRVWGGEHGVSICRLPACLAETMDARNHLTAHARRTA